MAEVSHCPIDRRSTWTLEDVAQRLKEAATTSSRLPPVRVQGYLSSWPTCVRQPWEQLGGDVPRCRPAPPSPRDEEHMLQAMRWVQWLDIEQRHLVWMRAQRYPWRDICARFACDRTTAWRRWQRSLEVLAQRLNEEAASRPSLMRSDADTRVRPSRWDG